MSGKKDKKLRKVIRDTAREQRYNTWSLFFETITKLPLRERIKLSWRVLRGKNIRGNDK